MTRVWYAPGDEPAVPRRAGVACGEGTPVIVPAREWWGAPARPLLDAASEEVEEHLWAPPVVGAILPSMAMGGWVAEQYPFVTHGRCPRGLFAVFRPL